MANAIPYTAEAIAWKNSGPPTPADGASFKAEFDQLYANDNYLSNLVGLYLPIASGTKGMMMVLPDSSASPPQWTYSQTPIRQYNARSGFTIAANDLVTYYPGTATIQTNGKRFVQYGATQVASLNRDALRQPMILPLTATTFVVLYSHVNAGTGIAGVLGTLNAASGPGARSCSFSSQVVIQNTGATAPIGQDGPRYHACVLSATVFVVGFAAAAQTSIVTNVCIVSAGTFTVGANQSKTGITASWSVRMCSTDANDFLIINTNAAGGPMDMYGCSVSGSTVTYGTVFHLFGGGSLTSPNPIDVFSVAAGTAAIVCASATSLLYQMVTISGTTITNLIQGTACTIVQALAFGSGSHVERVVQMSLSEDKSVITVYIIPNSGQTLQVITLSTETTTAPTAVTQMVLGVESFAGAASNADDVVNAFGINASVSLFDELLVLGGSPVGIAHVLQPLRQAFGTQAVTPAGRVCGYLSTKTNLSRTRSISLTDATTGTTGIGFDALARLDNATLIAVVCSDNGANVILNAYPIEVHKFVGVALDASASPTAGGIRVQRRGSCALFSSLTAGQKYFLGDSGSPALVARNWELGDALSTTEIDIDIREIVI